MGLLDVLTEDPNWPNWSADPLAEAHEAWTSAPATPRQAGEDWWVKEDDMDVQTKEPPKLPPVWFKHFFWRVHRFAYRLLGARVLWTPRSKRGWGAMHLATVGRKSGERREVIVGYIDADGSPVVLAMNGWDEGLPAWWLNVEAHPDVVIRSKGEPERPVRARRAEGDERDRLWRRWAEIDEGLDAYAASREADTPVVVFEPLEAPATTTA